MYIPLFPFSPSLSLITLLLTQPFSATLPSPVKHHQALRFVSLENPTVLASNLKSMTSMWPLATVTMAIGECGDASASDCSNDFRVFTDSWLFITVRMVACGHSHDVTCGTRDLL